MTVYFRKERQEWWISVTMKYPDGTSGGRKRFKSPRNTRRAAEAFERDYRDEQLQAWRRKKLGVVDVDVPTISEFKVDFERWAEASLSRSAQISYASALKLYIVPRLGAVRLDSVTTGSIAQFTIDVRKGVRRPLKPASVNNVLGVLSKLLNVAADYQLIPAVPKIHWMRVEEEDHEYWEFDEVDRVLEQVDTEPRIANIVRLALATGMRMGEVCGLQWGDVDFTKGVIHVRRQRTKEGVVKVPKWNSKRRIPMSDAAREALTLQKPATFMRRGTQDWIFVDDQGLFQFDRIRDGYVRIVRKSGVKWLSFHGTRHTFASHAVMRGVPIEVLQQWLGHRDINMTMGRYAHLSPHYTDTWIERMNGAPSTALVTNVSPT